MVTESARSEGFAVFQDIWAAISFELSSSLRLARSHSLSMMEIELKGGARFCIPAVIKLAAQALLVSVVGSALQMETQLEVKGKNDKELYELEL